MKIHIYILLLFFTNTIIAQNIGVNKELPQSTVDVKGDLRIRDVKIVEDFTEVLTTNEDNVFSRIKKENAGTSSDFVKNNETVTLFKDKENGAYTYTSENSTETVINVPEIVISNFETIIKEQEVIDHIINTVGPIGGNVYYDGSKFEYTDASKKKHILDVSALFKSKETLTKLTKESDGTYIYVSEDNTQTKIEVAKDVEGNFEKIAESEKVLEIIRKIGNEAVGNVVFDGNDFHYINSNGVSMKVDMSAIVKEYETESVLVDNKDGSFTYFSENAFDSTGKPIISKGVTFKIPEFKSFKMSYMDKYKSSLARAQTFSYKNLVYTRVNGTIHAVNPNIDFEQPYYSIYFEANSNPSDTKFIQTSVRVNFYVKTINNIVLTQSIWYNFEVEFLVNKVVVYTNQFKGNMEQKTSGNVNFTFTKSFSLDGVSLKNKDNLFEIRIKPARNIFAFNVGTESGNFNRNETEFLRIRATDVSFQFFEK